jgi:hypothetical protein
MKQMANRLYRSLALKAKFCSDSTIKFPRIAKEKIEANWRLAKSLITPQHKVEVNGAKGGSKSSYSAQLKVGTIPKNLHVTVAKEISKTDTVFIEEGEFRGVLFKIITGNPEQAAQARAVLTSSQAFEDGVTVLVGDNTDLGQSAYFDKTKKLVVAGGVSDSLLQETINSLN